MSLAIETAVRIFGAFLAIYSFAYLIETPKRYVLRAGLVGAFASLVYNVGVNVELGEVLASFLSALAVAFLSHTFARIFKAPVTLFLIAGILPTVPGTGMYQTVHYIIEGNQEMTAYYLTQTLEIAGVIALAIFIMDTVFGLLKRGGWKQNSLKYVRIVKSKAKNEVTDESGNDKG